MYVCVLACVCENDAVKHIKSKTVRLHTEKSRAERRAQGHSTPDLDVDETPTRIHSLMDAELK